MQGTAFLTLFSVVPPVLTVTINYHHTTGSRAPSLDDDEEEEDRLHAMISMICSRNLTDPNVMKGFYHLNTPTRPCCPTLTKPCCPPRDLTSASPALSCLPLCCLRPSPLHLPTPPVPASSACVCSPRLRAQQCSMG